MGGTGGQEMTVKPLERAVHVLHAIYVDHTPVEETM